MLKQEQFRGWVERMQGANMNKEKERKRFGKT